MAEVVSLKVDEGTKRLMELHEEINWSAVMRKSIEKKLQEMEFRQIDTERVRKAIKNAAKLRKRYKLKRGEKTAEKMVREWRDRRRW